MAGGIATLLRARAGPTHVPKRGGSCAFSSSDRPIRSRTESNSLDVHEPSDDIHNLALREAEAGALCCRARSNWPGRICFVTERSTSFVNVEVPADLRKQLWAAGFSDVPAWRESVRAGKRC